MQLSDMQDILYAGYLIRDPCERLFDPPKGSRLTQVENHYSM